MLFKLASLLPLLVHANGILVERQTNQTQSGNSTSSISTSQVSSVSGVSQPQNLTTASSFQQNVTASPSTVAAAASKTMAPVTFTPAASPGANAPTMNPNFFGYHYELATWPQYAANCVVNTCKPSPDYSKNQFTDNMYNVATSRTNGIPIIRLGGTSTDFATYHADLSQPVVPQSTRIQIPQYMGATIGPKYFQLAKQFTEAKFVIQVPIGYTNGSEWITWAKAAYSELGSQIEAIEIGNEPNRYKPAENAQTYSAKYLSILPDVQGALPNSAPAIDYYQAFDTAIDRSAAVPVQGIDLPQAFQMYSIDKGNSIKQVGWHFYPYKGGKGGTLQPEDIGQVFNHDATVKFINPIGQYTSFLAMQSPPIPLIWSEIALAIDGLPGSVNNFGTAMWNVDAFLYSMSVGVDSIHYSENEGDFFIFWLGQESDGVPAQVFAPFYAVPFVADFIGNSGKSKIQTLDTNNGKIIAYGAYEGGQLMRIALLNLNAYGGMMQDTQLPTLVTNKLQGPNIVATNPAPSNRPSVQVNIKVPSGVVSHDTRRLSAPLGAYQLANQTGAGITMSYDGLRWDYQHMGKPTPVMDDGEHGVTVGANGMVTVSLDDTSAALVILNRS